MEPSIRIDRVRKCGPGKSSARQADWDAGDIRYNVLRWTSSPSPRYSGYGPSFVDPRTGEILGADIMLEWSGMTGRLWRSEVFQNAGYEDWTEEQMAPSSRAQYAEFIHRCDAGSVHAQQTLFGAAALRMRSFTDMMTKKNLHVKHFIALCCTK
jgi:hypothetical protein